MMVEKNGVHYHINPDVEKITELINDGYKIMDNDLNELENPIEYATQAEAEQVHTISIGSN